MPQWKIEWVLRGTATVDADDSEEAEDVLTEALSNFETYTLEAIDAQDPEIESTTEVEGG